MDNYLVCIEAGHESRTRSAVEQVIRLFREAPASVHLLMVKPPVSGHVAMYFDAGELQRLLTDWAREDLKPAQALLEAAGVPYSAIVRIGQSARTIAAVARDYHCGRIVFGVEPPGLSERLFGSIAEQVRHLLQAQGDPEVIGS
jgi:nucleotide-binding universal stress UspA family protein